MVRWGACVKRRNDSLGVRLRSHRTNASSATREGGASGGGMASPKWVSRQRGVISHQSPVPRVGYATGTEARFSRTAGSTSGGNGL